MENTQLDEWIDPIVEEVRKYREEHAAKFNYDIEAIVRDIKKREKESGRTYISPPSRQEKENNRARNTHEHTSSRKAA
jgi:hypothetical protein